MPDQLALRSCRQVCLRACLFVILTLVFVHDCNSRGFLLVFLQISCINLDKLCSSVYLITLMGIVRYPVQFKVCTAPQDTKGEIPAELITFLC